MTTPSGRPHRRQGVLAVALAALISPLVLTTPASASSTANEIVYTADDNNDGVYAIVIRDLESRRVSTVLPADTTDEWIYDDPELSPDGQRVAFSTDRGSTSFVEGISVVNRDGGGFRRLTNPPTTQTATESTYALDVAASWSPDSTRLLFTRITVRETSGSESIDTQLMTVPVAGGAATPLPGADNGYTADWSPDGSSIVFAALPAPTASVPRPDSGPLTIINADGTGKRQLAAEGLMPAWSPDGSTIAYATVTARDSDRTRAQDTTQIATIPAAGGTARILAATRPSSAPTVAEYPSWSPDGESILYDVFGYSATDAFPPGDIWAVDRDGVRAGRVTATAGDEAQVHAHGPAPAPVAPGAASTYVAVTPQRILDTREGLGAPKAKVPAGEKVTVQVRGLQTSPTPVPADATAVVLNVTVTGTTAGTDVRAFPSSGSVPNASNINAAAGQTVPNLVTVAIGDGATGGVSLFNSGGSVNLIADIAGYYVPGATGRFVPVTPSRFLDTRSGVGGAPIPTTAGGSVDVKVAGTRGVPAGATAAVLNLTGTGVSASTDVRAYPVGASAVPTVSNLNLTRGVTRANAAIVKTGNDGRVRIRNAAGQVNLIGDLAGYMIG